MSTVLAHSDNRGRISLGKVVQPDRDYRITTGSHGVIILEPVTTISDYEAAVLARPELVAALEEGRAQLERGEGVARTRQARPARP
jgi:hypothetical protein